MSINNMKDKIELISETKNELNNLIMTHSMSEEKKQHKVFSRDLNVNIHFYSLIKNLEVKSKKIEVEFEEYIKSNNNNIFYKLYFFSKDEELLDKYYNTILDCIKQLINIFDYSESPSGALETTGTLINISDIETKYGMKKMMLIQLKNQSFVFGFCNDKIKNEIEYKINQEITFKANFERLNYKGFSHFKRFKLL